MTDNPYNSPNSELENDSESQRSGSLWKGIVFGGLSDLGGTIIMSLLMGIIYMALNGSPDMTPDNMEKVINQYVEDMASFSNSWGYISLALGLSFSVLGGYVCVIFAREKWKKALLILAAILTGYSFLVGSEHYQFGVYLALILLSILAVFFGGWLRARKRY